MDNSDPQTLAERLRLGEFISAPGIFELISARIADRFGFPALYMTGYGTVASYLGLPDAGLASFTDMLDRVRQICAATKTPVIADADTASPSTSAQTGLLCHVAKRTVPIIFVKTIRYGPGFTIQTLTAEEKDVEPAIVIVVEKRCTATNTL